MKKKIVQLSVSVIFQVTIYLMPSVISAQSIVAGAYHNFALCNTNTLQGWGSNSFGEMGNGISGGNSNVPVTATSLSGIIATTAGIHYSAALKSDGTVWAWGININGQLGNGSNEDSNVPVQVASLSGIIAIAGGGEHMVALKDDGTVWTWGYNGFSQLGDSTTVGFSNVPVQVKHLTGIAKITAGNYHSMALQNNGTLWAWGYNGSGELGNGTNGGPVNVPVAVSLLSAVIEIAAGNSMSLALKSDGTVYSWGNNNEGELGNGFTGGISNVPVQVFGLTSVIAIAEGTYHGLAVKSDGTVWGWGFNLYGQLGNASNADSNIPVMATGLNDVIDVSGGYAHSLALRKDGSVWSYGYNSNGQLGDGDFNDTNVPVEVDGLCSVLSAVNEMDLPTSLSVSPNPGENEFTVSGTNNNGMIVIFDVAGKEIFRNKASNVETRIKVSNLQPGFFLLTYIEGIKVTTLALVCR